MTFTPRDMAAITLLVSNNHIKTLIAKSNQTFFQIGLNDVYAAGYGGNHAVGIDRRCHRRALPLLEPPVGASGRPCRHCRLSRRCRHRHRRRCHRRALPLLEPPVGASGRPCRHCRLSRRCRHARGLRKLGSKARDRASAPRTYHGGSPRDIQTPRALAREVSGSSVRRQETELVRLGLTMAVRPGISRRRAAAPGDKRRACDRPESNAGDPPHPATSAELAIALNPTRATRRTRRQAPSLRSP